MLQSILDSNGAAPDGSAASQHTVQAGQQAGPPSPASELRGEGSAAGAAPAADVEELSAVDQANALSLAEKAVAVMPEVEPRIELRRCPRRTAAASDSSLLRVTSRKRLEPYALKVQHAISCMHSCSECSALPEVLSLPIPGRSISLAHWHPPLSAGRPAAGPCPHRAGRLPALGHHPVFWRAGGPRAAGHHAEVLRSHEVCVAADRQSRHPRSADCTPHVLAAPCTSHQVYTAASRGMLGWLVNHRGVPLDEVSFRHAVPQHKREVSALHSDTQAVLLWR